MSTAFIPFVYAESPKRCPDTIWRRRQRTVSEPDVTTRMPDDIRLRALMLSYQSGDLGAFDQLYPLLLPAVRGVLRRQELDTERVADLAQETFLQIHRARHTYDPGYPVIPWVGAIARHVWLMQRRAAARRPQPTAHVDDVPLAVRAEAETHAGAVDLRAALGGLSPDREETCAVAPRVGAELS